MLSPRGACIILEAVEGDLLDKGDILDRRGSLTPSICYCMLLTSQDGRNRHLKNKRTRTFYP